MKILLTGAQGQVGSEIVKIFALTGHELISVNRQQLDCIDLRSVAAFLSDASPDLVINAAAYTTVDKAEDEKDLVFKVNAEFVRELALYCQKNKIPCIHLSTDYVFDGNQSRPYTESDTPNPQNIYAQSKWAGEQAIQTAMDHYIILRLSWVFGLGGTNFVKTILNYAASKKELKIVADQWGRPTAAKDIARVILKCVEAIEDPSFNSWGIYHYAGKGTTNWYEFASVFISMAEKQLNHMNLVSSINLAKLVPITSEEYPCRAKRPKNSVLNSSKIENELGIEAHSWQDYLPELIAQFIKQAEIHDLSH